MVDQWMNSSIIHDSICLLSHKCHPKSYHSDIKHHMTLNIIFTVAPAQPHNRPHVVCSALPTASIQSRGVYNLYQNIYHSIILQKIWANERTQSLQHMLKNILLRRSYQCRCEPHQFKTILFQCHNKH